MFSLQSLHTFGLAAQCQALVPLTSVQQIQSWCQQQYGLPFWMLGEGSNSIFLDDFTGCVLHMQVTGKTVQQNADAWLLQVGAGENWHQLVHWCLQQGIYGLENLALIPGTVGAAPIQNIGAYGMELCRFLQSVDFIELSSGEKHRLTASECQLGYRDSIFKGELKGNVMIYQVNLTIPKHWQAEQSYAELQQLNHPTPHAIFDKVIEIRQSKLPDPAILGNAGSFFKNPVIDESQFTQLKIEWPTIPTFKVADNQFKLPAAWLIDKLGFKGKRLGQVACHERQPLVLVNLGRGQGHEVVQLARQIQTQVKLRFDILLENEVNLIGASGAINL